jgi:hypothetical protein
MFALTLRGLPLSWTESRVRRDTRALNVRVGLVRSSRGFGQIEEPDVIHAHWMSALALWRHQGCSSQLVVGWSRVVAWCSTSRVAELLTLALWSRASYSLPASRARANPVRRRYSRWLARRQDSGSLALRAKLLCGRFPQEHRVHTRRCLTDTLVKSAFSL